MSDLNIIGEYPNVCPFCVNYYVEIMPLLSLLSSLYFLHVNDISHRYKTSLLESVLFTCNNTQSAVIKNFKICPLYIPEDFSLYTIKISVLFYPALHNHLDKI